MFDVVIRFINFKGERLTAKISIESEVSSINVVRDIALKRLYEVASVQSVETVRISNFKWYAKKELPCGAYYKSIEFMDEYNFIGDVTICRGNA